MSEIRTIRWGIIGTGVIAHRFAEACKRTPNAELAAVASRTADGAKRFGDEFDIPHCFSSYMSMAESDVIDAVYIATPHGSHADNAVMCMNKGKPVLCEKPITLNSSELMRMLDCAEKNNVFLMEAMWARLVPGTIKLHKLVADGIIGEVRGIRSSFCYDMSDERDHHVFDPAEGGGSLLDVGCYCLSFADWYSNSEVESITAVADVGTSKTDEHCCVTIKYKNGAIAELSSATTVRKPNEGYIFGTKGYIRVARSYAPQKIELFIDGNEPEVIETPYYGNGFEEQITEASDCIRTGKVQSDIITHAQSVKIMKQMDTIRSIVGVRYPPDTSE